MIALRSNCKATGREPRGRSGHTCDTTYDHSSGAGSWHCIVLLWVDAKWSIVHVVAGGSSLAACSDVLPYSVAASSGSLRSRPAACVRCLLAIRFTCSCAGGSIYTPQLRSAGPAAQHHSITAGHVRLIKLQERYLICHQPSMNRQDSPLMQR